MAKIILTVEQKVEATKKAEELLKLEDEKFQVAVENTMNEIHAKTREVLTESKANVKKIANNKNSSAMKKVSSHLREINDLEFDSVNFPKRIELSSQLCGPVQELNKEIEELSQVFENVQVFYKELEMAYYMFECLRKERENEELVILKMKNIKVLLSLVEQAIRGIGVIIRNNERLNHSLKWVKCS